MLLKEQIKSLTNTSGTNSVYDELDTVMNASIGSCEEGLNVNKTKIKKKKQNY